MSFAAGFVPTFGRACRSALRRKRALILILALALPPVIAIPVTAVSPDGVTKLLLTYVNYLYLLFLVPLTGLLFGSGVLADDSSGGNLPYLFVRPVSRASILLGKFSSAVLLAWIGLALSMGATLLVTGTGGLEDGFARRAMLAVFLALPAYIALFAFLSVLTRWGLLAGFLYVFGVESFLSQIPGMIKKITLLYYSRSMLGTWSGGGRALNVERILGGVHGAPEATCVLVLLGVTVVGVVATLTVVRRKEFVSRQTEAA